MAVLIVIIGTFLAPLPTQLSASGGPLIEDPGPLQLEVIEQWPGGLVVELTLNGMAVEPVNLHQQEFQQLLIPGAGRLSEKGRPELPAVGRYIAVPDGARVEVEVLASPEVLIPNLRPIPHQPPHLDDHSPWTGVAAVGPDPAVYQGMAVYPARRVELETPRDIHGCRVALLKFYPVRYDPAGPALLYTSRLRIRLLFQGGNGQFIDPRHRSPAFERFFHALLLNPDSLGHPPGNLGGPPPACEMLIITPTIFETEALRLAAWKNQRGIPTQVRTTTEIGTTFEAIDGWIEDRYHNEWPELSYLLFFGDVGAAGSVPCRYFTDHGEEEPTVGTDLYYAVIGGGKNDYFPDLFQGRISVVELEEARQVVNKILEYEQGPDTTSGWLDSVLLAAEDDPTRFFVETSEAIYDHLAPLGFNCTEKYESTIDLTEEVLAAINEGVFLVTHRGHGQDRNAGDNHTGWVKPSFTENNVDELDNAPSLPVMMSVNCRSGWFDGETDDYSGTSQSFCELLLRKSPGGVVGVIGDTRTSYSGYNDELLKGFIDAIWDQFDPIYPDGSAEYHLSTPLYQMGAVLNFGKFWMYDKYILSGGQGYPDNEEWWPTELRNRIQFEVYHYHGDPSMEIWTGTPADDWDVLYTPAFFGDTSFTVTAVYPDDALVAVSRDGVLLGRAVSSGHQAVIHFAEPLDQLGDLTLCVTRHDRVPYVNDAVEVEIPAGPWVLYQAHHLDDQISGGNGDGLVSPGETVGFELEMHNFGTATAQNVVVTVSCDGSLAQMVEEHSTYPGIDPGQTGSNAQPLSFQILSSCPDGELVTFTVSATDGMSSWESEFLIGVDGAHITYYSHQVLDNLPGGGNQDYLADPGELVDLRVSLRNIGLVYASQVRAELSTEEPWDSWVSFEPPDLVHFPNLAAGNVGTSFSPHFQVALHEKTPCGTVIPFTLLVTTNEGQSSTGFNLLVGGLSTVFADDMEQGQGDWTSGELEQGEVDWSRVDIGPEGDENHAWFSPGENMVKDNWLRSQDFGVTRSSSLSFFHRVDVEPGYDGCVLEITTDNGENWIDLGKWITQGSYTHQISDDYESPIGGRWAWSGTSGHTMTRVVVDLDHFAGYQASIRYRLACDSATVDGLGWHIDDLEVEGVECSPWISPDHMISLDMVCVPPSGTLPFDVFVEVTISNDSNRGRVVAATLDLQLAGGYYMADMARGFTTILVGEEYVWNVNRIFPGHPMLVGTNTFRVSALDVTPPPYNVPPNPVSGDTAVDTCEVECLIP